MVSKKGAIEMSVGTIIIIVLALTMLILGLVLVRSIMCSGIQISEDVGTGVKNQVKTLFSADKYGVACEGEGSQEVKLATGGRRKIICLIKTEDQAEYSIAVKTIKSLKGAPDSVVQRWVLSKDWEGPVSPGSTDKEALVLVLDIPKDAPTTTLQITMEAQNKLTGAKDSHTSIIDIVPVGFFRTTLC